MRLKVVNPYDQRILCEFPYEEESQIDRKLDASLRVQKVWKKFPLDYRIRQVKIGIERILKDKEIIARDISLQMGKPIREALREVDTFKERAEHLLAIAGEALKPDFFEDQEGVHRRIEHAPLGLVFNIAAWNYPLIIPANVIIPALLAGNTVIIKHSGKTPLCGQHLQRAFGELDPVGLVSNLVLSHSMTARIIRDWRINYVAFTGSVPGGVDIYREAAARLLDVGLELGGKDPAYVASDADLDFTVANVVDGACYNAGQSCCAIERVYVAKEIYDKFLSRAQEIVEKYKQGDPINDSTTMGPLASRPALSFLEKQTRDAVLQGARILHGGKRNDNERGNFFPPTLLADVPNEASVMQEESFGPIIPIQPVLGDDEALAKMQDTRYGLTASIWTSDRQRAERFAAELETGTLYQNRCDYLDPALPWTGVRDSGIGSTLSIYGFRHLTRRMSINFRTKI